MVSKTFCFSQLGEGYVCYFCGETKKGYVLLPQYITATTEERFQMGVRSGKKPPGGKLLQTGHT